MDELVAFEQADARAGIERMDDLRYHVYTSLLSDVFGRLLAYYGEVEREAQTSEAESMALYVQKILDTIAVLRLKYSFNPMHFMRPGVDLAASGFPHFHDINTLDADLSSRGERLPKLPELELSQQMLLEHLMSPEAEVPIRLSETCRRLQWRIAERAYLESLDLRKQFFRFTPGKLFDADISMLPDEKGRRGYHFSWGCWDSEHNRPCVYFILVTQDEREQPLNQKDNPLYALFLRTIDNIASRAPEALSPIATRLDEAFRSLHPKALKRFCLGPLISPILWEGKDDRELSELAVALKPVFQSAELETSSFVLFFSTEIVSSDREVIPQTIKSVFGIDNKPRQIFHVPKNDRNALRRGASAYKMYCIMPHRLRQHLGDKTHAEILRLLNADSIELLTYQHDEKEVLNVG